MGKKDIDYAKLYEALGVKIKTFTDNTSEGVGYCPFHKDEAGGGASFAFNAENGLWKCFTGCGHGDVHNFICKKFRVVRSDAEDILDAMLDPIDPLKEPWEAPHKDLLNNGKVLQLFHERRGLNKATVEKYRIGYNGDRYTIPIVIGGILVNIRKYSMEKNRAKMTAVEGHNTKKLFPYENLFHPSKVIHIMEGEMDCLLANQLGINAVTVTAGAGNWKDEWSLLFKEIGIEKVVLCYDIDQTGIKGAKKIRDKIRPFVKDVIILKLPIIEPPNGDFTDYVHGQGHTLKEYEELVLAGNTKTEESYDEDKSEVKKDLPTIPTTLHLSSGREYYYRRIKVSTIVSGKNLTPFLIPRRVEFNCPRMAGTTASEIKKKCLFCTLAKGGFTQTLDIDETSTVALKIIGRSDEQVKGYLRGAIGVPQDCNSYTMKILDTQNVEEIRVIPDISFTMQEEHSEYVSRLVYYLDMQNKRIKTNASYELEGVVMPHPNTQASTILISKSTPAQTDIDTFVVTPEVIDTLKIFRPSEGQTVAQKVNEIVEDLIYNVTKMYQRDDLVIGFNLISCSALEFYFMGDFVDKGRVEGLFLGDKGCGKSKTIERLIPHFRAGELVTGENLSYAGLVGGISSDNGAFMIQWGKLPLNDRRMVWFDEKLKVEVIEQMSATRSSGIAEITKIQSEKTFARVRLGWSANPRSGRNLNTYSNGVIAVQELMGAVEDTRRLDFAITATETDVDLTHVEDHVNRKVPHIFNSDRYSKLILWAWSRKRDQIEFTTEAVEDILKYSNVMAKKYSSAIPLVEPTEQRIKIARLAVACAAWMHSTDNEGEKIIVKPEHVEFIHNFLTFIYDKPSMAYNVYSASQFKKTRLTDEKRNALVKEFKAQFLHWDEIRDALLDSRTFRKSELMDQTGMSKDEAADFFRWTARNKLIGSGPTGFTQSPIFMEILQGIRMDENTKNTHGAKAEEGGI